MAIFLVIFVIGSTFAGAIIYLMLLTQSLTTQIRLPGLIGFAAGAITLCVTHNTSLPTPVRNVQLPVIMAAVCAGVSVRRNDWQVIANTETTSTASQAMLILAFCLVGAIIGVLMGVGKPVLIALDQDVIGSTIREQREIAIVGGVFAGAIGAVFGTIAASWLPPPGKKGS